MAAAIAELRAVLAGEDETEIQWLLNAPARKGWKRQQFIEVPGALCTALYLLQASSSLMTGSGRNGFAGAARH